MKRKNPEIVSEVDPYDMGSGPKRENFYLQSEPAEIEPVHTERAVIHALNNEEPPEVPHLTPEAIEQRIKNNKASLEKERAKAVSAGVTIVPNPTSIPYLKKPEIGRLTGRTYTQNAGQDELIGKGFPAHLKPKQSVFGRIAKFFGRK
ncbi:MAG: hypothetical protein WC813_02485 [Patescibacteria group bacterium]|jgi:hypothetical protein